MLNCPRNRVGLCNPSLAVAKLVVRSAARLAFRLAVSSSPNSAWAGCPSQSACPSRLAISPAPCIAPQRFSVKNQQQSMRLDRPRAVDRLLVADPQVEFGWSDRARCRRITNILHFSKPLMAAPKQTGRGRHVFSSGFPVRRLQGKHVNVRLNAPCTGQGS